MLIAPAASGATLRPRTINPAQVLVFGFAAAILVGTLLLMLPQAAAPGVEISWLDALFTATSAVCVTGLVVVNTATTWSPFGQAVILVLIQIGGLGLMTMSTLIALLLGKKITLRERLLIQLQLQEVSLAGLVRLTRYIVFAAFCLEGLGAILLALRFARDYPLHQALWLGVFHAVSAFNNAGFDLFGNSLLNFATDPLVIVTIALLIILGGIGFSVLVDLTRWRSVGWRGLSLHSRVVLLATVVLVFAGTLALLAFEYNNPATLGPLAWEDKLLGAFFQAVSPRTAGFNSVAIEGLTVPSLLLIIMFMFIGGSPGSTAGGVKTTTVVLILSTVWATVSGASDVNLFRRRIERAVADRALTLFLVALLIVVSGTQVLLVLEGSEFLPTLFEVTSAFGTVGLSMGLTPELSVPSRLVIIVTMFIGRVGPLTLGFALAQRRARKVVRYPEDRVMIG